MSMMQGLFLNRGGDDCMCKRRLTTLRNFTCIAATSRREVKSFPADHFVWRHPLKVGHCPREVLGEGYFISAGITQKLAAAAKSGLQTSHAGMSALLMQFGPTREISNVLHGRLS